MLQDTGRTARDTNPTRDGGFMVSDNGSVSETPECPELREVACYDWDCENIRDNGEGGKFEARKKNGECGIYHPQHGWLEKQKDFDYNGGSEFFYKIPPEPWKCEGERKEKKSRPKFCKQYFN
jgi:hypothetical protein